MVVICYISLRRKKKGGGGRFANWASLLMYYHRMYVSCIGRYTVGLQSFTFSWHNLHNFVQLCYSSTLCLILTLNGEENIVEIVLHPYSLSFSFLYKSVLCTGYIACVWWRQTFIFRRIYVSSFWPNSIVGNYQKE